MSERYTILARKNLPTASSPSELVLCKVDNPHHPYVTWHRNKADGSVYWGHYHESFDRASEEFLVRCTYDGAA